MKPLGRIPEQNASKLKDLYADQDTKNNEMWDDYWLRKLGRVQNTHVHTCRGMVNFWDS